MCHRFRNHPTKSTDDKIKALELLLQEKINEGNLTVSHIFILNKFTFQNNNSIFKCIKTIVKSSNIPPLVYLNSMWLNPTLKSLISLIVSFDQCSPLHLLRQTCKKHLPTITITLSEVYRVLVFLDPNKAFLHIRVLHTCASVLCKPLYLLIMMSLKHAIIPEA